MKNIFYIISLIILSGTLSACSNETIAANEEEKTNKRTSSSEIMAISETKEIKNTDLLKEKSLYQFEASEGTNEYIVFVYAEDEQSLLREEIGQGGKNPLYKGHYSIYLAEKDSAVAYKQGEVGSGGPFVFNQSSHQAYAINLGKNTIIAILESGEHGNSKPFLYSIKDGELREVYTEGKFAGIFGTEIKNINHKYLQTAHLQENNIWKFITWEFDEETLVLKLKDETELNAEEDNKGEYWYNRWQENSEFYFPFLNLELSSDVVEKAKQGIPLGSPYPIGTNIANIKKSEPNYMEDAFLEEPPYLMYPDITYYYDKITGTVTAVSIPGERVKTTLDKIKELFGKPDQEERDGHGEMKAIYNADKYVVEILSKETGEVEDIYLRKK
ncbi:hypothetical protein F7731_11115 [Cytobacillus depressus]|uniref:DUF4309 domain-containing protein n=1 Tax=Cytobacillus depressus TaxID=1602942 RepID=A0A6L3V715_9BACI|nr:hypothetical protein [Cytobacillus depressus]KAB2336060.1 hypothetical protein F7731_11115 [Cytobacillus depressus]